VYACKKTGRVNKAQDQSLKKPRDTLVSWHKKRSFASEKSRRGGSSLTKEIKEPRSRVDASDASRGAPMQSCKTGCFKTRREKNQRLQSRLKKKEEKQGKTVKRGPRGIYGRDPISRGEGHENERGEEVIPPLGKFEPREVLR